VRKRKSRRRKQKETECQKTSNGEKNRAHSLRGKVGRIKGKVGTVFQSQTTEGVNGSQPIWLGNNYTGLGKRKKGKRVMEESWRGKGKSGNGSVGRNGIKAEETREKKEKSTTRESEIRCEGVDEAGGQNHGRGLVGKGVPLKKKS